MNIFALALLACGALSPDTPAQKIVGAEKPIPLGELVDLHVPPLSPAPAHFHSASYSWKVIDPATGETKVVRRYSEDGKQGVYFGAGVKAKKLKVFCAASYLFAEKDGAGKVAEVAVRTALLEADVTVGEPGPPTPPIPPPDPPAPVPAGGLGVLIVYQDREIASLAKGHQDIIFGKKARDYLHAKCEKEPDGRTAAFRIWDNELSPAEDLKQWQEAFALKRDSLPWLVVLKGGKPAWQGRLPDDADKFISLVSKYEGK